MSDRYIEILEFGRDNPGFTRQELHEKFPVEFKWLQHEIQRHDLFVETRRDAETVYFLSFNDRFRLMEHQELKEARQSSRRALWFAGISLLIAASTLLLQLFPIKVT